MGLPRAARLGSRQRIRLVCARGRRASHPLGTLHALPSDQPGQRLCVVLSRRLGGAVARNRVRRRLQEQFRAAAPHLGGGWDLVLRVAPGAMDASSAVLGEGLRALLQRVGAGSEEGHGRDA